jgi:hypothetical protein
MDQFRKETRVITNVRSNILWLIYMCIKVMVCKVLEVCIDFVCRLERTLRESIGHNIPYMNGVELCFGA